MGASSAAPLWCATLPPELSSGQWQGQLLAGERGQGQLCSWGVLRQEDISALPLSFCCTAFIRGSILL